MKIITCFFFIFFIFRLLSFGICLAPTSKIVNETWCGRWFSLVHNKNHFGIASLAANEDFRIHVNHAAACWLTMTYAVQSHRRISNRTHSLLFNCEKVFRFCSLWREQKRTNHGSCFFLLYRDESVGMPWTNKSLLVCVCRYHRRANRSDGHHWAKNKRLGKVLVKSLLIPCSVYFIRSTLRREFVVYDVGVVLVCSTCCVLWHIVRFSIVYFITFAVAAYCAPLNIHTNYIYIYSELVLRERENEKKMQTKNGTSENSWRTRMGRKLQHFTTYLNSILSWMLCVTWNEAT